MSNTQAEPPITFDEFSQLCEEAGIQVSDKAWMEHDYRQGVAIADVTDHIIEMTEDPETRNNVPTFATLEAAMKNLAATDGQQDVGQARQAAISLAAEAVRFVAANHDERGAS